MNALALLAIALYAAAAWRLGRGAGEQSAASDALGLGLGTLAVLCHGAVHGLEVWRSANLPLHFVSALSWVSLGMAVLSTGVAFQRRFDALGSAVYPLALITLGLSVALPASSAASLSWPLRLHALLALLAYATLAIAALLALLLWLQERLLRQRRLDHPLLRRLPPLTELEQLMFRTLGVGFVLLTLALTIGAVFVENLFAQHLVHKTVLSLLSWSVFAALLIGRVRHGWRGRRAIRMTLIAMTLLLLAFFGSKFVLELVLGRTS